MLPSDLGVGLIVKVVDHLRLTSGLAVAVRHRGKPIVPTQDSGFDHVLRWMRVLKTFDAIEDMTAAEAQDYADQHLAERWDPVVEELRMLEASTS